jgi:type II secretory pathway pseudopilin PulG
MPTSAAGSKRPTALPPGFTLLELLVVGGMVMLIVLAVLMPIMQLNQWVK